MKRLIVGVMVLVGVVSALWADGGRERLLLPVEREFYEKTQREAEALMPKAPAGWVTKQMELMMPKMVGEGSEKFPIFFDVVCEYQKPMTMDTAGAEQIAKDMEGFSASMEKFTERMNEALAKGDQKALAAIQKEMQEAMNANAGIQKIKAKTDDHRRNSATVRIRINAHGSDYWPYKEIPPKPPAVFALRSIAQARKQESESEDVGRTLLFFGPYKKEMSGETIQIYQTTKEGVGTKVHRLILEIEAEEKVVDELLATMDLNKLAGLIK